MKTNQLKHFIIIAITSLGLLLGNCTSRQISSSGKVDNIDRGENKGTNGKNAVGTEVSAPVKYEQDGSKNIVKIHFANGKEFDLYENNPYKNLDLPKGENYTKELPEFNTKGKTMKDVIPNFDSKYQVSPEINENTPIDAICSDGYISANKNYYVADYSLKVGINDYWMPESSSLYVFDSNGKQIYKLENIGVNAYGIHISSDGRFLFIIFGWDDAYGDIIKYGFRVYDLQTKSLAYEELIKYESCRLIEDLFIINEGKKEAIVDMYKMKRYSRSFTNEEDNDFIKIDKKGYLLGKQSGNNRYLLFEKDFKVEQIIPLLASKI